MNEAYQDYTYKSPFALKRWLHQKRFDDAIVFLDLKAEQSVLDYGCGDGYFLELLKKEHAPAQLFGFEPAEDLLQQAKTKLTGSNIKLAKNTSEFGDKKFDKIICMETCEHLPEKELDALIENIKNLLTENGVAILSVPVEIGFPALFKNTFRFIKNRKYDNLSIKNYFRTFLGLSVRRKTDQSLSGLNYIYSHIGFDYRAFERILQKNFKISSRVGSPFASFNPFINNTVYYFCTKMS